MSASPIQSVAPLAAPTTPLAPAQATAPTPLHSRRRRLAHLATSAPVQGVAQLAPAQQVQQLPFAVGASVSVRGSLLKPILGAVIGTLLLGLPGTILGGIVGFMLR
jgi:hypothetical protein